MILRVRFFLILLAALGVVCLAARPALAGEDDGTSDVPSVKVYGDGLSMAEIEDGKGKVQVTTYGAEISYSYFTLSMEQKAFNFDDVEKMPFGNGQDDPWDTLSTLSLSAMHSDVIDEEWGYFLGGGVAAGYEEELSDSLQGFAYAGVRYAFSKDFAVHFGAGASVDQVEVEAMPLLGLRWRNPSDLGFSASLGIPETGAQYRFDEQLALRISATGSGGIYRLADESTVSSKGYLKTQDYKAGMYVDWNPVQNLKIEFGPEFAFGRTYTTYTKDGDKIDEYDVDPAWGGSLRLQYEF